MHRKSKANLSVVKPQGYTIAESDIQRLEEISNRLESVRIIFDAVFDSEILGVHVANVLKPIDTDIASAISALRGGKQ